MTRVVPAFFVLGLFLTPVLVTVTATDPAGAIPSEKDPFPDPNEKPAEGELSPGEMLIQTTSESLRNDDTLPGTPERVQLALLLYAESKDPEDLKRAVSLARSIPDASYRGLGRLWVARAGARDALKVGAVADRLGDVLPSSAFAVKEEEALIRALLSRDPREVQSAAASCATVLGSMGKGPKNGFKPSPGPNTSETYTNALRAGILAVELTGSKDLLDELVAIADGMIKHTWSRSDRLFTLGAKSDQILNTLHALPVLWQLGFMAGETKLKDLAASALDFHLPQAAKDPRHAPAAAFAAARIQRYPVQMVLIGSASDPQLTRLREACTVMFEPRGVMIHLDPARDAERIEELMYPVELAPVLFVCIESICSAPIKEPEKVEGVVASILAASQELPE